MKQLLAWLPTPPLASVCTLQRENQHRAEEEEPKINTTIARSTGREVRAWAWHTHTHRTTKTTTITGGDYLNGCGLLWSGLVASRFRYMPCYCRRRYCCCLFNICWPYAMYLHVYVFVCVCVCTLGKKPRCLDVIFKLIYVHMNQI